MSEPTKTFTGQSDTGPLPPRMYTSSILCFKIHRFADLPHKRGKSFNTNEIKVGKHSWYLEIFPRGDDDSNTEMEYISIYLHRGDFHNSKVTASVEFKCSKFSAKMAEHDFYPRKTPSDYCGGGWGRNNYLERSRVLDPASGCLDKNGTLTINVTLNISAVTKLVWYPTMNKSKMIADLLLDPNFSDITFAVENETFKAHRFILRSSASALDEIANDHSSEGPIALHGVTKKVFAVVLKSIYTIALKYAKSKEWKDPNFCEDVLKAADRFGISKLKLLAESFLADVHLKVENAAHMMILADSYSCPLLAEAATSMYKKNPKGVMNGNEWHLVQKSTKILHELLVHSNSKFLDLSHKRLNTLGDDDIESMGIGELRDRLQKLKLQLDGTRSMLVKRLQDKLKEKYHVEKQDENIDGGAADQDMNAVDDAMYNE